MDQAQGAAAGVAAIEGAQTYRNKFLAVAADGSRPLELKPWNHVRDAIPKNIGRAAAQLRYYDDPRDHEARFDVNAGLEHTSDLIRKRASEDDDCRDLHRRLLVRMGGRGERGPLTERDHVLLWETLAIAAECSLQARERDVAEPTPLVESSGIQLPEPLAGIGRPVSSQIRALMQEYCGARFAGRSREVAELHAWLRDPGAPLGMLAAEAGRGKSALLVQWITEVVAAGNTDLVYIPVSIRFGTAHVAPVAKAMAGRLRHLSPGKQPIPVDDPFAALDECKDILGTDWPGPRPLLVILDGIDEAIGWKASALIPTAAGQRIKLLVAARGAAAHWIEQLSWTSPRSFDLEPLDRRAVQALVASVAELRTVASDDAAMERFLAVSGGDPLVVQLNLQLIMQERDASCAQRFSELLQGELSGGGPMKRFFNRWWEDQRIQWKDERADGSELLERVLALLACAKGPLRLADLCALEVAEPEAIRDALGRLSRLVIVDLAGDRYVFGHSRLHDYFVERLREAGTLAAWKRRYLDYAAARFDELSMELPSSVEDFSRRFDYALRYYALHLEEDAADHLTKLMSRHWLEGWRRLEAEDGVHGGFYEDISRAERHARSHHMLSAQVRGLLIKASITSLSSNVPPLLMRRLVETRLWPVSRALRVIDCMVNDNERATSLGVLAGGLEATDQRKVMARALDLSSGYRTRALAWMMPDLAEIHREQAFEAILVDGTLFDWHSLVSLDHFVEALPEDFAQRLLAAARAVADPERRLRALSEIAKSAESLPAEARRAVLVECELLLDKIEKVERRVYHRRDIASAAMACASDEHPRLLQATLQEIRTIGIGDREVLNALTSIATSAEGMDPATRANVIAALWDAVDSSTVPWLALSLLGPHLARLGFASQILERSGSSNFNEHSLSTLLASLLPYAGEHFDRVWNALWRLKRRDFAIEAAAHHIRLLSDEQRTAYFDTALGLIEKHPEHSDLLSSIARRMVAGDREAQRLLAAVRALPDPTSRAMRLVDCVQLVPEEARDGLVREILQDARDITPREYKRRLLVQLVGVMRTDQSLLLTALATSRQICDEQLLVHAIERVAVTLAASGDGEGAVALVKRASETFADRPSWLLEVHIDVIAALPQGDERTALWNSAVLSAHQLQGAFGRAWFLAALAPVAPVQNREEHALVAWAAIERIDGPSERAYAVVPLLPALDEGSRKAKLEWVFTQLAQDMSRPVRFRVVRDLMSRLDGSDLATYRPTLEASIDRVLRRTSTANAEPGGDDVRGGDVDYYFEELVPLFELTRTRDTIARCPPEHVSTLELLALRLAELDQRDEALDAIRRLQRPDDRARALAHMLDHSPAAAHAAILKEVHQNLESADEGSIAEAEAFLVDHLTGIEREQRIVAALERAHSIRNRETRHDTFLRLAASAAAHLRLDQLEVVWAEFLRRTAIQRREDLITNLVALLPILSRLTGHGGLRTLGGTLLDVAQWFP